MRLLLNETLCPLVVGVLDASHGRLGHVRALRRGPGRRRREHAVNVRARRRRQAQMKIKSLAAHVVNAVVVICCCCCCCCVCCGSGGQIVHAARSVDRKAFAVHELDEASVSVGHASSGVAAAAAAGITISVEVHRLLRPAGVHWSRGAVCVHHHRLIVLRQSVAGEAEWRRAGRGRETRRVQLDLDRLVLEALRVGERSLPLDNALLELAETLLFAARSIACCHTRRLARL